MKKLILIVLFCYSQPYLSAAQTEDRWYTLTIGTKPAGYYHETVAISDSSVTNQIESNIRISRLGSETVMDSKQFYNRRQARQPEDYCFGTIVLKATQHLQGNNPSGSSAHHEPGSEVLRSPTSHTSALETIKI